MGKDGEGFDSKKDTEVKSGGNRTQYLTKSEHLPNTWSSLGVSSLRPCQCSPGGEDHLKGERQISEIRLVIRLRIVSSPSTFIYLDFLSAVITELGCFISAASSLVKACLFFSNSPRLFCSNEFCFVPMNSYQTDDLKNLSMSWWYS